VSSLISTPGAGGPTNITSLSSQGLKTGDVLSVQNAVQRARIGSATALTQFSRQMGATIGVSVMGVIVNAGLPAEAARGEGVAIHRRVEELDHVEDGHGLLVAGGLGGVGVHRHVLGAGDDEGVDADGHRLPDPVLAGPLGQVRVVHPDAPAAGAAAERVVAVAGHLPDRAPEGAEQPPGSSLESPAGAGNAFAGAGEADVTVPVVPARMIADPTGVGDAFRAGFLAAIGWGLSLERAAQLGNLLAVTVLEADGPQEYELKPALVAERLASVYGQEAAAEIAAHYG